WSVLANSGAEAVRPQRGNKLTRDRLTLTIYFTIGLWGWFVMSIGPMVPIITERFGVSKGVGGLHGTAIALGAVSVGLVSHRDRGASWLIRVPRRFVRSAATSSPAIA